MTPTSFATRSGWRTSVLAALAALAGALPAHASEFPLLANDLEPGERVFTFSHSTSDPAQTGGKDIQVLRRVANNDWRYIKENPTLKNFAVDLTNNDNYLIYNRPVHAMAAGRVVACWRNAPENKGNVKHAENSTGRILLQGNHLWILQNDGKLALYAHAQTGGISATLCPHNDTYLPANAALSYPHWSQQTETVVTNGATVTAGQFLFRVGNSGNSSQPHLHVHVVDASNNWQPMTFARGMTTPFDGGTASLDGPWTPLAGNSLPSGPILIWPPHPVGNWTHNGISPTSFQRLFDHYVDSGLMPNSISCTTNGASYDTTWIPGQGQWRAYAGALSGYPAANQTYTNQAFRLVWYYGCGSAVGAIWRKP